MAENGTVAANVTEGDVAYWKGKWEQAQDELRFHRESARNIARDVMLNGGGIHGANVAINNGVDVGFLGGVLITAISTGAAAYVITDLFGAKPTLAVGAALTIGPLVSGIAAWKWPKPKNTGHIPGH